MATMTDVLLPLGILLIPALGLIFLLEWRISRRREMAFRERQFDVELRRTEEAREREESERWEQRQRDEEHDVRATAGGGTGGYIVLSLSDEERPLFHDLLKGFEEYAALKGYAVSFSIDSSFADREVGVTARNATSGVASASRPR